VLFRSVLAADAEIGKKLALFSVRDGHAPMLSGKDLNAYILAGLQSDHESTGLDEAREKLRRGMFVYVREGSTEKSIEDLIPAVNGRTVSRCCFATDDRHADTLVSEGHINHCVRKAIECGLDPELAIRMATLSAADRFGLFDRGALSPGRRADFCIVNDPEEFVVQKVFRDGVDAATTGTIKPAPFRSTFRGRPPTADELAIPGKGKARVIGLVPNQIVTESLVFDISSRDIPDLSRDILKIVVCNRYHPKACGIGLVHGFKLKRGAIATSVSHDAHNIIATGTSDTEIRWAVDEVFRANGAMAAVVGNAKTVLPLDCAGLMSTLPYPEVNARLQHLHDLTANHMDAIEYPFMYLSFLALTVIPALRITDRGVFDAQEFRDVPLFY
jgi:adenine deaminase